MRGGGGGGYVRVGIQDAFGTAAGRRADGRAREMRRRRGKTFPGGGFKEKRVGVPRFFPLSDVYRYICRRLYYILARAYV